MNRNEFGARQQPYTFHGVEHREIGLRAVAAAILYQGGNVERAIPREQFIPLTTATPSGDHEP